MPYVCFFFLSTFIGIYVLLSKCQESLVSAVMVQWLRQMTVALFVDHGTAGSNPGPAGTLMLCYLIFMIFFFSLKRLTRDGGLPCVIKNMMK